MPHPVLATSVVVTKFIPICAHCGKVRDANGVWQFFDLKQPLSEDTRFTHGICPPCARELYPDLFPAVDSED